MRVHVITEIAAPAERVWKALTRIEEVRAWDGVVPFDVSDQYPEPGQHARWHSDLGPLQLMLHDRIMAVEEKRRLNSIIDIAFVHVSEEYVLTPRAEGGATNAGQRRCLDVASEGPLRASPSAVLGDATDFTYAIRSR